MIDSSQWATMTLSELVDLRLSSVDKKSKPDETPVLLCNYTDVYRNRIIHSDLDFMEATATDREIEKCALQPGDVVITKDSEQYDDIGVPALIRDDAPALVCGYHLAILRPRADLIDGGYLFNALTAREVQHQFYAFANGVTRFGLRKADIERVRIPVPPMGEQRRIAGVLGCLDDKIELNRRMAGTLEEMARALFRSWFVDFEPVRAKQEGRWRSGESLPGLPAQLYEAFPERLEGSALGPIPAGWRVAALGDVVVLGGGGTPSTKRPEFWEGGEHCWATPRDLAALTSPVLLDTERKITDAGLARISSGLLPKGTLLMSSRAPIGYLAIASVPVAINQGFIAITAKERMSNLFMLHWCHTFHERIMTYANGSTFLEISKANFRQIPLVVPGAAVVKAFDGVVWSLTEQIAARARETRCLAAQRDALLQRLIASTCGGHWMESLDD